MITTNDSSAEWERLSELLKIPSPPTEETLKKFKKPKVVKKSPFRAGDWDSLSALMESPAPQVTRRSRPKIEPVSLDLRYVEGSNRKLNDLSKRRKVSPKHHKYESATARRAYIDAQETARANRLRVAANQRKARRLIHGFTEQEKDKHTCRLDLAAREIHYGNFTTEDATKRLGEASDERKRCVLRDKEADRIMKKLLWFTPSHKGNGEIQEAKIAPGGAAARRKLERERKITVKHTATADFLKEATLAHREAVLLRKKVLEREKQQCKLAEVIFPTDGYPVKMLPTERSKQRERDIPLW
eukprot:g5006.t1